ncbi:hypothetical protein [Actinokineospora pegani]|uniref:hypothetical protein n=1 Tax=Actinokineospora pegani TaxID=2654637 RepID=UPI0012EA79AF|nr:hypothetical protein [Actinokineospora pegani]
MAALGVAGGLLLCAPGWAVADPEDHELVFCLAPHQQRPLREAAVALGADRGKVADLAAWRKSDAEAFDQACTALYEANKVPSPDTLDQLLPFLTGLFGAVTTYAATAWQTRVTAGRAERDALGREATEFHDAVVEHVTVFDSDGKRVEAARTALTARLLRVVGDHPSWPSAQAALEAVTTGPLSADALARATDQAAVATHAQRLLVATHRVAGALATPGRPHRALRRDGTAEATG